MLACIQALNSLARSLLVCSNGCVALFQLFFCAMECARYSLDLFFVLRTLGLHLRQGGADRLRARIDQNREFQAERRVA